MHIGFILDGNRTWAKNKWLPSFEWHRKGYDNIAPILDLCISHSIEYTTLWVLSDKNIQERSHEEVSYLFDLLTHGIKKLGKTAQKKGIRLCTIWDTSLLPESCLKNIHEAECLTRNNTHMTCIIAIGYGWRNEITRGIQRWIAENKDIHTLNEASFWSFIESGKFPPIDLIVRTGWHMRHSWLLLYGSEYAEYFFTPTLWPDFGENDFDAAMNQYKNATRKFGK